jgi:hypothetical protein
MNVYATWTLDKGSFGGVVVTPTGEATMRTPHNYTTPEQATEAAQAMIDALVSA